MKQEILLLLLQIPLKQILFSDGELNQVQRMPYYPLGSGKILLISTE